MHVALRTSLLFSVFISFISFSEHAYAKTEFAEDELLVQVRHGASHNMVRKAIADHGASVREEISQLRVKRIKIPAHLRERVLQGLSRNQHVVYVEPNYIAEPTVIPNDPGYPTQWHLPKISAPLAWDMSTGLATIDIAVADSGVDPSHPDLAGKLLPGFNFYDNNSNTSDVYGHGTMVAGVSAATGNNGVGVSGVAWNCSIMPLRVTDTAGYGYYSMIANAIIYAADHGVRIINVSFGGTSSSVTLQNAVDYAWSKGTMVFASAGNSSTSTLTYPAACNRAIAVSATDSADSRASYSNYGAWITVAAPGTAIYTTLKGGGYGSVSGTSFSAPITAGVAAMVLSINPTLSNQQVVDIIKQSTEDLGVAGFDQYFGYGRVNVAKAVAAAKNAVAQTDTQPPTVSFKAPVDGSVVKGITTIDVAASDNVGIAKVELTINGSLLATASIAPFSFSWDTSSVADGVTTLEARAYDSAGNTSAPAAMNLKVQNTADTIAPVIKSMSPADGASIAGLRRVTVAATATDNIAVARMELYLDGHLMTSIASGSLSWSWNLKNVSPGSHTIMVKAYDTSGNSTVRSIRLNR